ncbi:hypothetical protein MFLAVUS_010846 [Mucor flavus]|uniref:Efficient mitochondria targeting-associated protein 19 n=1 Tax=Mucor flavus TaxID=439312 RepID=A0ABP9ZDY0_9FUNG
MAEKKSIFSRPLDLIYFVYFATHIPVTLGVDFQLFYPSHWVPTALSDALDFYINTFKDPFMGSPTTLYWFASFICCELVVQLPFFFIACIGLLKDCKYIRLPLAIYGAHVATTVLPTIVEVLFNPKYDLDQTERLVLCGFYGPYFVLPLIMIIDSYIRINKYLNVAVPTRTTNPTTATKKSAKIQ